jgi:hypothetical protein
MSEDVKPTAEKMFKAEVLVSAKLEVDPLTLELVSGVKVGDISEVLSQKTVELENEAVREALIGQGWTPPPKV